MDQHDHSGASLKMHRILNHRELSRRQLISRAATLSLSLPVFASLLAACEDADVDDDAVAEDTTEDADDGAVDDDEDIEDEDGDDDDELVLEPEEGTPQRGGTITAAVQNDWVTKDPVFNTAEPTAFMMIYDPWIRWVQDPDDGIWGPEPWLVESWELEETEATLELRSGVEFHDGTEWDAEAAKWNLDRLIFHPQSGLRARFTAVDTSDEDEAELDEIGSAEDGTFTFSSNAVEVIDDYSVRIHLAHAMGGLLSALSAPNGQPISPTAFNELGRDEYASNPVGTGPMTFVEWQSGDHVTVERNPNYWVEGADGELLPYLDGVEYRLIIDDSVRLLDLTSGNVQFTELIQGRDLEDLEQDPDVNVRQSESQGNNYRLIFDSTNENSAFANHLELRRALLYALDREAMVQTLGFGAGVARHHLLPEGSFAYPEDVESYTFDPDEAERLIQQVMEEDPSIVNEEGRIPFTLTVIQREIDSQQAEMIKQFADSIGFDTNIEILERAAWTAALVQTPGQEGGEFEVATMRNPVTADDPDQQWRTFYHSAGGFNVAHIADPELDDLLDRASASYDEDERIELYTELAQWAYDTAWYGFLWQQNWNWAYTSDVKGFDREPVTNGWIFTEMWVEDD